MIILCGGIEMREGGGGGGGEVMDRNNLIFKGLKKVEKFEDLRRDLRGERES
jgi:hypothetical protein